jgi:hypothetical protein
MLGLECEFPNIYGPSTELEGPARVSIGSDVMSRMLVEIATGVELERSILAPMDEEHRAMWDRLAASYAEIRAAGQILAIPSGLPSLDGYERGRRPGLRNVP